MKQTLLSAVHGILASNIEKVPKAADKTVRPDKSPKTKRRFPPPSPKTRSSSHHGRNIGGKKNTLKNSAEKKLRLSERFLARK